MKSQLRKFYSDLLVVLKGYIEHLLYAYTYMLSLWSTYYKLATYILAIVDYINMHLVIVLAVLQWHDMYVL